jgi:hypothetical protein
MNTLSGNHRLYASQSFSRRHDCFLMVISRLNCLIFRSTPRAHRKYFVANQARLDFRDYESEEPLNRCAILTRLLYQPRQKICALRNGIGQLFCATILAAALAPR